MCCTKHTKAAVTLAAKQGQRLLDSRLLRMIPFEIMPALKVMLATCTNSKVLSLLCVQSLSLPHTPASSGLLQYNTCYVLSAHTSAKAAHAHCLIDSIL